MKRELFLYKQIYEDLRGKMDRGELVDGARLPPMEALTKQYGVSAITVTGALNALKEDGCLVRIKGKGSFVRLPQGAGPEPPPPLPPPTQSVNMIGLVLEHVSSCFGLDLLYAMDQCAQKEGYHLCVRFSYGDRGQETDAIRFLQSLGVKGLIVMPCHGTYYNTEILKLVIDHFPVVLIDKRMEGIPVSSVRTDNYGAMEMLVEYLVSLGKRKLGFITVLENGTTSVRERRKGFRDAVKTAGLAWMPECRLDTERDVLVFSDETNEHMQAEVKAYLRENEQLDALVCAEYGLTRCLGMTRQALQAAGLTVCCVDEDYLSPGNVHFPHVRQNERKIASEAVRLLLLQIREGGQCRQGDCLVPGILRK